MVWHECPVHHYARPYRHSRDTGHRVSRWRARALMGALFDNVTPFPVKQKSNEWYTPAKYIEAAREVMGGIDLDPASCELANRTIRATRYYSKNQDGLRQKWHGNVWLNPPYGRVNPELKGSTRSLQTYFAKRLLESYQRQETKQAIALLFGTSLSMPWFTPFWQYPICVCRLRINFDVEDGTQAHFGYGNIFVYLGPHEQTFIDVFSRFGTIAKRVSPSRERPMSVRTLWDMEAQA
jgi:DNA N-6-adenine-methyltransferase (Dam)